MRATDKSDLLETMKKTDLVIFSSNWIEGVPKIL
jgi:hypothetical protein